MTWQPGSILIGTQKNMLIGLVAISAIVALSIVAIVIAKNLGKKKTEAFASKGRHVTTKKPGDATYSPEWSGVSYAPTMRGKVCSRCGSHVHLEGDGQAYCPQCDDYVSTVEV